MIKYKYTYSFVIPHKNTSSLLKRCISSIPRRRDIQIIIIDDNSNEQNLKEAEKYAKEKHVDFISLKESKGAGYARNLGISKAEGKWLLFADADDFYSKDFIKTIDLYKDSNLEILYFSVYSVDSNTLLPANRSKDYDDYIFKYNKEISGSEDYIKYKKWEVWNKMFSNEFIVRNNIRFEEISKCNDMIFCILSSCKAKNIQIIPEKLYCITYNPNSITYKPTTPKTFIDSIKANKKKNLIMEFIGHPTWKESIFIKHLYYLKKEGIYLYFKLLLAYIRNLKSIRKELNEFVSTLMKDI